MFDIQTELHLRRATCEPLAAPDPGRATPVIVILMAVDLLVLSLLAAVLF